MELRVVTKNIKVEVGDKDRIGLEFRQPTESEILLIASCLNNLDSFIETINKLFIEFSNKPIARDEDGNNIDFKDFNELMSLTTKGSILSELLISTVNAFTRVIQDRRGIEKK